MTRHIALLSMVLLLLSGSSCIKMKHEMTIQPVHITVEIRIKIDRALDDFFGDLDARQAEKVKEETKATGEKK